MQKLYIIATPIGNLKEINQRAIDAFNDSTIIYCEDTRVTKKLLTMLKIDILNKKLFSLNGFNENQIVDKIDFDNNQICALVSDAGYPLISDPGYLLMQKLIQKNINYEIVNGPSSVLHALIGSGFKTNHFYFAGFIPTNKNDKTNFLVHLKSINSTLIIFESVHKIKQSLNDIKNIFGDNVKIVVAKELTKVNEKYYRGSIDSIIESIDLRGEFVIIIDNSKQDNSLKTDIFIYLNEVKKIIQKGTPEKIACKMVGYKYDISSKELFNTLQQNKNIV